MKYLLISLLILVAFILGCIVGVKHYQSTCEPLSWQGDKWLECEA